MRYIISFWLLASTVGFVRAGTAVISGKLDFLKDGDTVKINLDKYGQPWFTGFQSSYKGAVKNNVFHITVPTNDMPVKIESFNFGLTDSDPHFLNVFVEDGDSINITGTNGALTASGKGSNKWKLIHELDSIYFSYTDRLRWGSPTDVRRYFEFVDSTVVKQLAVLEAVKLGVSLHAYHLLKANIIGLFHVKKVFFDPMPKEKYAEAVDSLANYRCGLDRSLLDDPAMLKDTAILYSDIYANGLAAEYLLDSCIKKNRPYAVKSYYEYLCSHYSGLVRERLLTNMLYKARYKDQDTADQVRDALGWITYKDFRDVLIFLNGRIRGATAYNFSLPDSIGHLHYLSEYKGKVVLLDFWYTGCGNCIKVHPYLDSIQKLFAGEAFECITINADKDRSWWTESLRSGKYTSPGGVNLNTDGKGYEHPVIIRYAIAGYPNLILVDKQGKLMLNPTDPREDRGASLVRLVEQGLSE